MRRMNGDHLGNKEEIAMAQEAFQRIVNDAHEELEYTGSTVDRGGRRASIIGCGRVGHCDGVGHRAAMHRPFGICSFVHGGATTLAFTDCYNNAIRLVLNADHPASSVVCTVENCGLLKPKGLCVSDDNRYLFVCDTGHHRIKFAALPPSATALGVDDDAPRPSKQLAHGVELFSFAGSGEKTWKDGPVLQAGFNSPGGVCESSDGTIVVADTGNHCIRAIRRSSRVGRGLVVSTIAGGLRTSTELPIGQSRAGHRDGDARDALFRSPSAVIEGPFGELLVADTMNHCIRALIPTTGSSIEAWNVSTVCGRPQRGGYLDGSSQTALFCKPIALCRGPGDTIFVSDAGNNCIRQIGTTAGSSIKCLRVGVFPYTWVRSIDWNVGVARPLSRRREYTEDCLVPGMTYQPSATTCARLWLCNSIAHVIEQVSLPDDIEAEIKSHWNPPNRQGHLTREARSDTSSSAASSVSSGYTASSSASASAESTTSFSAAEVHTRPTKPNVLHQQNVRLRHQNASLRQLLEQTLVEIASVTNSMTEIQPSTAKPRRGRSGRSSITLH